MMQILKTEIKGIHSKVDCVIERLKVMEVTLQTVQSTQQRHEDEIQRLKAIGLSKPTRPTLENEETVAEIEERISRKANLVVRVLPESKQENVLEIHKADAESFREMLDILDVNIDSSFEIKRVGKITSDRPRLLKVKFSSSSDRDDVLRQSKCLRNSKYKNVYINKDLTPHQQKEPRALLQELKARRERNEDVMIRGNRVVSRTEVGNSLSSHFLRRF